MPFPFVKKREQVLTLYLRCKEFNQSPSEALGLTGNRWVAWQMDEVVFGFGRHVEAVLSRCKTEFERDAALKRLLNPQPESGTAEALIAAYPQAFKG